MLSDVINFFITGFDTILQNLGIITLLNNLISFTDDWQNYQSTFNNYLSGVYFLFGKSLVIYIVTAFGIIVVIRIIMALINIIGQYVP